MSKAGPVAGRGVGVEHADMELAKFVVEEGVMPVASAVLRLSGFVTWLCLVATWCLLVLVFSGRLPWFVRRYF